MPNCSLKAQWPQVSSIFPGTIISDIGGMVTVSATVIRNVRGMASMRRHTWVVPSTESTPAPTSKVHWCDRRKSTPMMTGTSISETTMSCVQSPSQVSKLKSNDTRPKELVTLPSANRIRTDSPCTGTYFSLDMIDKVDGWITDIVDPVSTKPMACTPPILTGRYKLPDPSIFSSTSSRIGPRDSSAANSGASAAASNSFPDLYWDLYPVRLDYSLR